MMADIPADRIKILICCHARSDLPVDSWFLPIQLGAVNSSIELGMQRDDQCLDMLCDNISEKNESYCELTGIYWAWKNLRTIYPETEYIGVNHYRRYFSFTARFDPRDKIASLPDCINNYRIDKRVVSQLLRRGKVISAKPRVLRASLFDQYAVSHSSDDMRNLLRAIHAVDKSYDKAAYATIMRSNHFMPFNMMVCAWQDFEVYAEWLFAVLSEVEKTTSPHKECAYQSRVFGFMGERLWNVWLTHHKCNVASFPILDYSGRDSKRYIPALCDNLRKDVGYRLARRLNKHERHEFEQTLLHPN